MKLLFRYLSCTYLAHHELESFFISIIVIFIVTILIIINIINTIIVIIIFRYGVPALTPSGPLRPEV